MQTVRPVPVPSARRRAASGPARRARRSAAALGAGALLLFGAAAPAMAADGTWYVDQANGADGPGCGVEPAASACMTIGAALDQAAADDTITIAPGSYSEALAIDASITLEGDAAAALISDGSGPALSALGADVEVSVTGLTISPDPAGEFYAVVADAAGTVELSQVSIEPVPGATEFAPAVRAQNDGSVILADSEVLTGAYAPAGGGELRGGIDAIQGGDLTITRSMISPAAPSVAGITVGQSVNDPGALGTLQMTDSTMSAGVFASVAILHGLATITNTTISSSFGSEDLPVGTGIAVVEGSVDVQGGEIAGHTTAGIGNLNTPGTAVVTVNGTTIRDNGTPGEDRSGGIVLDGEPGGSLEVTNAQLIGNSTAIQTESVPTTVTSSEISGGDRGVVALDADLSVTDSQVVGRGEAAEQFDSGVEATNRADRPVTLSVTGTDISNYPVGLVAAGVRADVSTSTIADNGGLGIAAQPAWAPGGPIDLDMTITDTTITGNGSLTTSPLGAGLAINGGATSISRATIADNLNGMVLSDGDVTLADSSVTGSGAQAPTDQLAGFGIIAAGNTSNPDHEFTVTGSEISGNRAGMGLSRSTVVRNSTIANNTWYGISAQTPPEATTYLALSLSTMVGNGIEPMPEGETPPSGLVIGPGADVLVAGSVFGGSAGGSACSIGDSSGVLTDGGYNVVADASCALTEETSLADTDPLLGVIGDHGGPTQTVLPAADSPAVDLIPGGSTAPGTSLELCLPSGTDQRGAGFPRPQGPACDAGAVEIEPQPPAITTESLPDGIVGQSYTARVEATGGDGEPYDWAVTGGALPDGVELDPATGEISGEPTEAGTFEFTIEVDGVTSATFSVTVVPELVIVTDTLPEGTVGEPYTATLEATGGDGGPYTWGIDSGDLPDGLELNAETGEITGTPTAAESFTFTVVVGDPVYKEFTIEVAPAEQEQPPPPEETPPPADTPDQPGEETPAPDDGTEPEGPADAGDGELAVSGVGSPWGGLVFAALALLMGGLLLVLRRAGRLDLHR